MYATKPNRHIAKLFPVDSPPAVLNEVKEILRRISPGFNTVVIDSVFDDTNRLYNGSYPGYRACNTGYHDLRHANDTFLAMARLTHGAVIDGVQFTERQIVLGLICAIFHDTGYIQEKSDRRGTGAKYSAIHEQRSVDFLSRHGAEYGLSPAEIDAGRTIIFCTNLDVDMAGLSFASYQVESLGKMLSAADLMAQLADRMYLEKLQFLYREFREAGVGNYESELDILRQAVVFYDIFDHRLRTKLGAADRFMDLHFDSRWGIRVNLYQEMIIKQKKYLLKMLKIPGFDPRKYFRRGRCPKKSEPNPDKSGLKIED
jgi:hypothetical protein